MSRKVIKYTIEEKVRAAERYIKGEASSAEIAAEMGMGANGSRRILKWAAVYRANGIEGFHTSQGNNRYTAQEKQQVVESYLKGEGSLQDICIKFHIPSQEMCLIK